MLISVSEEACREHDALKRYPKKTRRYRSNNSKGWNVGTVKGREMMGGTQLEKPLIGLHNIAVEFHGIAKWVALIRGALND